MIQIGKRTMGTLVSRAPFYGKGVSFSFYLFWMAALFVNKL